MSNNILKPAIGQRIRAARKNADLTLAEVSSRIGISNQALSAIERGKKNPSRQTLMSIARLFGKDFGEVWLTDYLSEYQTEFSLITEPQGPSLDKVKIMNLFGEFLDTKYGAGQIKLVPEPKEKTVSIPVGYEILETSFNVIDNAEEYIHVPPQMFPPNKGAMAGIVKCKSLWDALVDEGDFVIITERPTSIDGKTILALVKFEMMLKRCEVKGEKVILKAFNESCRPIKVSIKDIICVGEFTGMIRINERTVSD